jgi:hypothetical protein
MRRDFSGCTTLTAGAPLRVSKERHVHGKRFHGIGCEPQRNLLHMSLAGVVEMLARGKNLNRLCASFGQGLQQSRMQPLAEKYMGGNRS